MQEKRNDEEKFRMLDQQSTPLRQSAKDLALFLLSLDVDEEAFDSFILSLLRIHGTAIKKIDSKMVNMDKALAAFVECLQNEALDDFSEDDKQMLQEKIDDFMQRLGEFGEKAVTLSH